MRLFVALEIPSTIREEFARMIDELRALPAPISAKKPRWVRPKNLHVTLKFIGHVEPAMMEALGGAPAAVRSEEPVELHFRGLGFFPNDQRPRVVAAGVVGSPNLASIADTIDQALATLGIPAETREFTPHLTLARCEPAGISVGLRAAMEKNAARDFGELRTNEFHLIESQLKRSGAEYTTLQSFAFMAEA